MWSAVLPVKRLSGAKTRLRGAVAGVPHPALALAVALDTVTATLACPLVERVLVVTDDPAVRTAVAGLGAQPVSEGPGGGLNAAFRTGSEAAVRAGAARVLALTGDLPALRPEELAAALRTATDRVRAFVADEEGTGTTLLTAVGVALDPRFGGLSAAAHERSGAVRLTGAWPSLRRDVDTAANLAAAARLGLGRHTAPLLGACSV